MSLNEQELNELRYDGGAATNLKVGDMIIVYKGNVYTISGTDDSDANVNYAINVARMLCKDFPGMSDKFFDSNGDPSMSLYDFDNNFETFSIKSIVSRLMNFEDMPRVLCFEVAKMEDGDIGLAISNSSHMDILNSKELHQFLQTSIAKRFQTYQIGSEEYDYSTLIGNESHKQNIPIAEYVYHGTCLNHLQGILTKGLRSVAENSGFSIKNEGYVFLTSSFDTAKEYANMYSRDKGSNAVVIEVATSNIDKNRIVNDWDFTHTFTDDWENAPYNNLRKDSGYKGNVANNTKAYGTRFSKFGYKGVIMPSAIRRVYIRMYKQGYRPFTPQEAMKYIQAMQNESVNHLNEWRPSFFDTLPDTITLRHGTTLAALDSICRDGVISARNGRQTGETNGVNWFTTNDSVSFGRGSAFSIQVPKSDFENGTFEFMNNCEVISRLSEIPIDKYNFRIEQIGNWKESLFVNLFKKFNGDFWDWFHYFETHNREVEDCYVIADSPVILRLVKQLFGDEVLRKEGFLESKTRASVNEAEAEDVSLSSFKVKEELHPKFWVNGRINSRVRTRLLDIANDFIEELSVDWVKPYDIRFTGSLANYNWSRYSDIDLHIVVDFKKVYKNTDFVDDYFKSKKDIWNETHGMLRIFGFPVEVSVEDKNQPGVSSGVYSLEKDKWVVKPGNFDDAKLNETYIKEYAARLMTKVEKLEQRLADADTDEKLERIGKRMKEVFDTTKKLRKESLARSGEMASGNIIWKILRRTGYLDRMWEVINRSYNKMRSMR